MNKDSIRKKLLHSTKKSLFRLILVGKICILPNYKVKKSVYTDKISMSGRSGSGGQRPLEAEAFFSQSTPKIQSPDT